MTQPTEDDLREFLRRSRIESQDWNSQRSMCFYGVEHSGSQRERLRPYGSGVLLKIADAHLITSAAHVLDVALEHDIPTYLSNGLQGSRGVTLESPNVHRSTMPEGATDRLEDPVDLAVVELGPAVAAELKEGKQFIRLSDLDPRDTGTKGAYYAVVGYPDVATEWGEREGQPTVTTRRVDPVAKPDRCAWSSDHGEGAMSEAADWLDKAQELAGQYADSNPWADLTEVRHSELRSTVSSWRGFPRVPEPSCRIGPEHHVRLQRHVG